MSEVAIDPISKSQLIAELNLTKSIPRRLQNLSLHVSTLLLLDNIIASTTLPTSFIQYCGENRA